MMRQLIPALLLFVIAAGIYTLFPCSASNPDGLRVFPGLREVVLDSSGRTRLVPRPWTAAYQEPYYYRANVQKHVLFPLYVWLACRFRPGQEPGRELKSLHVANALAAALTVGLIGLLIELLLKNLWVTLLAGLGLTLSAAFSSQATNLPEVVPALPGLALALLLIARPMVNVGPASSTGGRDSNLRLVVAGLALGLSAACYLASLVVGLALVVLMLMRRRIRGGLLMFLAMIGTTLFGYLGLLRAAGYENLSILVNKLTFMPTHSGYGRLRLLNAGTAVVGLANSLFPILPDDFGGLRRLISELRIGRQDLYLEMVSLPLIVFLVASFLVAALHVRKSLAPERRQLMSLGSGVWLAALAMSLVWDPYHPKLWMYSNVGFWLMVAAFVDHEFQMRPPRWQVSVSLFLLAVALVSASNFSRMTRRCRPDPKWSAAQGLAHLILDSDGGSSEPSVRPRKPNAARPLVVGAWDPEFAYLSLLLPETLLVCLPDLALEARRQGRQVAFAVEQEIGQALTSGRTVFAVSLFGRSRPELRQAFSRDPDFAQLLELIDHYRNAAVLVLRDRQTGITLHQLGQLLPETEDPSKE